MGWILNTTTNDIYTEDTVQGNVHQCYTAPYGNFLWRVNEVGNDVTHGGSLAYHTPCFTAPFPSVLWYVAENPDNVQTSVTLDYHRPCFDHPFPCQLWFVDSNPDDVTHDYFFNCEGMGAFRYCGNLSYVYIPKSVKSIGSEAFELTRLSEVTVASDCEYKSDSFPPNCAIYTYDV